VTTSYLEHSVHRFLDLVAAREPAPGGGSVAAVTGSLAAGLVAMAARYSTQQLPTTDRLVADADALRRRAAELVDADADAYRAVIAANQATRASGAADRRDQLRDALTRASLVPLEVAQIGVETAKLAARLIDGGNPNLRGDAATALILAEASVQAAARLVAINVRSGECDEDLVRRAAHCAKAVGEEASVLQTYDWRCDV